MHVKLTASGDVKDAQMSEVKNAVVDIEDLGGFPNDYVRAVKLEIEKAVLCVVNSEIRNVLKDSMRCYREGGSDVCRLKT